MSAAPILCERCRRPWDGGVMAWEITACICPGCLTLPERLAALWREHDRLQAELDATAERIKRGRR